MQLWDCLFVCDRTAVATTLQVTIGGRSKCFGEFLILDCGGAIAVVDFIAAHHRTCVQPEVFASSECMCGHSHTPKHMHAALARRFNIRQYPESMGHPRVNLLQCLIFSPGALMPMLRRQVFVISPRRWLPPADAICVARGSHAEVAGAKVVATAEDGLAADAEF